MTTFSDLVTKMNTQLEGQNLLQVPYFLTLSFPHLLPPVGETSPAILRSTARWHQGEAARLRHTISFTPPAEQGPLFKKLKYHVKVAKQLMDSAEALSFDLQSGAFYEWEGKPDAGPLSPS